MGDRFFLGKSHTIGFLITGQKNVTKNSSENSSEISSMSSPSAIFYNR